MVIEAGEWNQPLPLGSRDRKPPLSLGHQLHSGLQKTKGRAHLGVCAPCPHACPTPTPVGSSAEDPRPWGGGGVLMRGTSPGWVSSVQHLLY